MNQLGFAGHPGRGSYFRPDSEEIAAKAAEIEHRNHEEEVHMFEELQRANRENDGV